MSQIIEYQNIVYAVIIGLAPAIFWLWFFLKEDCHPEPKWMIIYTFLGGMATIPIALFTEQLTFKIFLYFELANENNIYPISLLFALAGIEEYLKYMAANKIALKRKVFDEPVDAVIYLIVAALGFAAFENLLFVFKEFGGGSIMPGVLSGNIRFLGPTLLHVASSSIVGISIAFSFFHKKNRKRNVFWGLAFATLLHTFFNYFIINNESGNTIKTFLFVWVIIIIILFIFEKIKKIKN